MPERDAPTLPEPLGRLALVVRGGGPAVVLGHALTLDASTLEPLAAALGAHNRVVTWEAPGHGRAAPWPGGWSHAAVAGALASDLAAAGIDRVVALGVSQGAYVSMHLALDHPDVVAGLVLLSCEAGAMPPAMVPDRRAEVAAWVRSGLGHDGALDKADRNFGPDWPGRHRWIDHWEHVPGARYAPGYEALFTRPDLRHRLGVLRCPTLVVRGDGDRWVSAEGARELAASIPGAEGPETVRDGHHNPQVTRPDAVLPVVEDFLDRLDWRR